MKFIFDLDNKDLLPRTLEIAKAVEDFSKKFGLKDLRTPPEEGESVGDAARRNLKALMQVVCADHPAEGWGYQRYVLGAGKQGRKGPERYCHRQHGY